MLRPIKNHVMKSNWNPHMPANIDLFWSFRSPYSYLATPGALEIEKNFDAEITFRPVLPLAVRQPDFFSPENLKRARYIGMDWTRRAEMLGMAYKWPIPDPIVQDLKTYKISDEQPYIYRLSYLGVEAQRQGAGIEFATEVSALIFGGTQHWNTGDHLAQAAARAGLNLEAMEEAIDEPSSHMAELEANQQALDASGHWGVPTFVYDQAPYFGQDRLDSLAFQLQKDGLAK